jgi:hypothetical protein
MDINKISGDINKISGLVKTAGPIKQVRVENGKTFADVLDKTVNANVAGRSPAEASVPVNGVLQAGCVEAADVNNLTIHRASDMLNLLESYAKALRDPKRSLKSIEPLVGRIRDQIHGLKVPAEGQDQGLLKLVDEIAVTATVETVKFQRGDYIV